MPAIFVYMTAGSMEEANKVADALISERLAACVNILPGMRSCYYWKGKVERDEEVVLIAKSKEALLPLLVEKVKEVHSYEVPCVVSIPISGGNPDFLDWIKRETR
ncbi:MAG: divalent-cation tolerance protein CutA [Deltaproteobacteria bacterium]|nr:divalent-cation tolerance protein CutA [Deltaproteobacteria bacterium]